MVMIAAYGQDSALDDCICNRQLHASANFTDQPYGTVGDITAGLLCAVLFHLIQLPPLRKTG